MCSSEKTHWDSYINPSASQPKIKHIPPHGAAAE